MQVQNSQRAKQFLVVVSSAIVYQDIEFLHSLALHLTALQRPLLRRSRFRQQMSAGVRHFNEKEKSQ